MCQKRKRRKNKMSKIPTFEKFLKESPDKVFDNKGNEINWNNKDAFTFGWFKLVPNIDPIFIRAAKNSFRITHDDLATKFCVAFSSTYNQRNPEKIIEALNSLPIRSLKSWEAVVKEIYENKNLSPNQLTPWQNLVSGEVHNDYKYIEGNSGDTASARTEVFDNSGRIWLNSKIISFWNKNTEIKKEIIDIVMDSFGVSVDRENFLLDAIDPQRIKDEGTSNKKLPTVGEFFGSKKEKSEPISKEQEKEIAKLLAQKHIETDPAKRKAIQKKLGMGKETPPWGSTAVANRNPIMKRQAEFTSESFKNYFTLKESPDQVYNSKGNYLNFGSPEGITFGWLKIIPNIEPIFVHSKIYKISISHDMIASSFLNCFSSTLNEENPEKIKESFQRLPFVTYPDTSELVDNFQKNPDLWKLLLSGDLTDAYIKKVENVQHNDIGERSVAYKYSGRVWPNGKVISFWAKLGDVPEDIVYKVFEYLNIQDGENFEIDLMDPDRLEIEGTENKKLPTVKELFSNKKGAEADPLTKDQQKKLAELMAKKHTETDPTKRKQIEKEIGMYDDTVKPWGSTVVAQRNPIMKRQAEYTSESFTFFNYFKAILEARKVEFGKYKGYQGKAKVYVNLHASIPKERKLVYSIQGYIPDPKYPNSNRSKSKVLGYDNKLVLNDVTFKVGESGWKKVQEQGGKKNVHSMVIGTISEEEPTRYSTVVTYDPRRYRYFVRFEGDKPIPVKSAKKVAFNPDGLTAEGVIDMTPDEIRSEGPLLTQEEIYYMQRRKEEIARTKKLKKKNK